MTPCSACKRTDYHQHDCPEYRKIHQERMRERLKGKWQGQDPIWHLWNIGEADRIRLQDLGVLW